MLKMKLRLLMKTNVFLDLLLVSIGKIQIIFTLYHIGRIMKIMIIH